MVTIRQKWEIVALAVIVALSVPTLLRKSGLSKEVRLVISLGIALFIVLALRLLK